ncbi:hypothetical protein phiPLPE_70 [Iodobacter phage PhiPLPE]|uniref:Uncharacterized protein n=1 Tax=Iodobacter phage PhiPLPE TaxID=551895 RepID=B5AX89_9CAUD|nr:hypothetical protein phiPLPE_70 [Iodobacter phage PhiPLPE]ACG60392.1 hypothetical protein phiPLPE_70 [Iodobacter phage PhiPLPE]
MKIFEMNDCEWFIGPSIEACKSAYFDDFNTDSDEARELTDNELGTLIFTVTDENEVPDGNTRTFREQLAIEIAAGGVFPRMFACTEY